MKKLILEGTIQGNERGYGFFIPDDKNIEDFFVSHGDLRGALHCDRVLAQCEYSGSDRTFAKVLKVLERGCPYVVGTYFSTKSGGFVQPDDKKFSNDVFIKGFKGLYAKSGDKVVCKIMAYPHRKNPEGIIVEILGRQFVRSAEVKSIIRAYNLQDDFSKQIKTTLKNFQQPTEQDFANREDFRNLNCFTIDGEDSRDFDDAVSIKQLKNGFELGVHIADVSHYVKDGSILDQEAFKRGTSVYFPESVIPMLPEKLSNNLCSLMEGVDRLTLSCIMQIDNKGEVLFAQVKPSVINSKARLTYKQVQNMLDGNLQEIDKFSKVYDDIVLMDKLADIISAKRISNNYVDLDAKESAISVVNGKINVDFAPRYKAHCIIEEFMILANVSVAKLFTLQKLPFVYRIHEKPDENKYFDLIEFVKSLGVTVPFSEKISTKSYNDILEKCKDNKAYSIINKVMIRSMQKAKYSKINKGHFGLNEELYCHFTSPIRRYPDLFVHRIIKDFLAKGEGFVNKKYSSVLDAVSNQSSETERNAMEAERAMEDYYKILYLSDYIGQEFDGIISGVTNFGIFVELQNSIEGLCKLETLPGKHYDYNPQHLTLSNGRQTYKFGDSVKIKVAGIDYSSKRAEFLLICNNACKTY